MHDFTDILRNLINEVLKFNFGHEDYKSMLKHNNRSSKRTDILHQLFVEAMLSDIEYKKESKLYYTSSGKIKEGKKLPEKYVYTFKQNEDSYKIDFEVKINDFNKTFDIDYILYKNGSIFNVYLMKFCQSSIFKNLRNNDTTTGGEILRITGGEEYINNSFKITFITIMPTITLSINSSNRKKSKKEYPFKEFSNLKEYKTHPILKDRVDVTEHKITFIPNQNYFDALISNEPCNYDNYIENVDNFNIKNVLGL